MCAELFDASAGMRSADRRLCAEQDRVRSVPVDWSTNLQLHPVDIAEEQRPLSAKILDVTNLAASIDNALLDSFEHIE